MALQRTRAARFARIGSALNARPLGAATQGSRLAIIAVVAALLSVVPYEAEAAGNRPARSIPVTWNFEAPDMPDVPEFNESGQSTVPIEFRPGECEGAVEILGLHVFQAMKGSSREREKKPVRDKSAGVVMRIQRQTNMALWLTRFRIESGGGDWSGVQEFNMPSLSAKQWSDLPEGTSWVLQREGIDFPRHWKRIIVLCE